MANAIAIKPPERSSYGAVELKEYIRRNTLRAFLYTIAGLALLFLIQYILSSTDSDSIRKLHKPPLSSLTLNTPPPQTEDLEAEEELAPPPPPTEIIMAGPAARAGTPVAVPDADLQEDLQEFADLDVLDKASSVGGEGLDIPQEEFTIPSNQDIEVAEVKDVKTEEIPPPDKFIPVEEEATTDMIALQRSIEYPEMARRAGIEGKVYVRVWIDKNGKPKRPEVVKSDSKMLNEAALKAIVSADWVPAVQNNQAVGMWVTVPINFKLQE